MKRTLLVILLLMALSLHSRLAQACPFTPIVWQQHVDQHVVPAIVGQAKHLTWIRDQNRNFIDDVIEARYRPGSKVDVLLDLNRCMNREDIVRTFSPFGRVAYIGTLITVVKLDQVATSDLPRLAARPEVAMIEQRGRDFPALDTASRAIQAHTSAEYPGLAAQDAPVGADGSGVVVAFIGTGITSSTMPNLAGKRVAGYDASNPNDPRDGSTDPADTTTHETLLAALAVGAPLSQACRPPGTGLAGNCAGIAPAAKYVNVRQCNAAGCTFNTEAVDWVGVNAKKFNIRVVSMAFSRCDPDDGTSAQAQQANYLASLGLVVVAAQPRAGNTNCTQPPAAGGRLVTSPASASFVIAVNASDDKNTVLRSDDAIWANNTIGPRMDFSLTGSLNWLALKPDLAVPGTNISYRTTGGLFGGGASTSFATAIAAGAAALVVQKYPLMPPDSVKQLLIANADSARNVPYNASTGVWDAGLGWGLLNVGGALHAARAAGTDVTFPTCGTGSTAGQPCNLSNGAPAWDNEIDLSTASSPSAGVANSLEVDVKNSGAHDATVLVNFGIAVFGTSNSFYQVGVQRVLIAAGQTKHLSQPWTPLSAGHQCAQISIAYELDSDYANNMTQRNLQVAPSVYHAQINTPFQVPAHFEVKAHSERAGWTCAVANPTFDLDPRVDCPRDVTITFDAPAGTAPGQSARCQVGVYAQVGNNEKKLVGGVTVKTYVPRPCQVYGQLFDVAGRPLAGARVAFAPDRQSEKHPGLLQGSARSGADGVFSLRLTPDIPQLLTVEGQGGAKGTVSVRPVCGLGFPRLVLAKDSLRIDPLPRVIPSPVPASAPAPPAASAK
jgi:hypothetical protein